MRTPAPGAALSVPRAGYGLLLLTDPDRVLRLGDPYRQPFWARPVLRVLGARHVGQAALLSRHPALAPLGALVDLLHICTDLACAVAVRPLRIPALTDASVAAVLAVADLRGRSS